MPLDRPNQLTGFGGRVMKSSEWIATRCQDATSIAQPYTGIGRHASLACHDGCFYETWDTQELCRLVIEGLYAKKELEINIDRPMFTKGYLYETRYLANTPDKVAGLIDYIFTHGSDAEKYVLAMALPGCTSRARLYEWGSTTVEELWKRFVRMRDEAAKLVNMPGEWCHHVDDFNLAVPTKHYDTLIFDPPNVFGSYDRYSTTPFYTHLNIHLGCDVRMDKWTSRNVLERYQACLEMDVEQILMVYNGDAFPNPRVMRSVLETVGKVVDEAVWSTGGSYTYVWDVRK